MELIIFLIIAVVFFSGKKAGFKSGGPAKAPSAVSYSFPAQKAVRAESKEQTDAPPERASESRSSELPVNKTSFSKLRSEEAVNAMSVLIEDREHDWLARQLRQENRIKKRGEALLDLGAAHDASCDAREIKRLHILAHDDSIDDGELL